MIYIFLIWRNRSKVKYVNKSYVDRWSTTKAKKFYKEAKERKTKTRGIYLDIK